MPFGYFAVFAPAPCKTLKTKQNKTPNQTNKKQGWKRYSWETGASLTKTINFQTILRSHTSFSQQILSKPTHLLQEYWAGCWWRALVLSKDSRSFSRWVTGISAWGLHHPLLPSKPRLPCQLCPLFQDSKQLETGGLEASCGLQVVCHGHIFVFLFTGS